MYLDSEKKREFFKKHGKGESDTGSAEGQIALFTYRISHLTQHLKANKKDYNTQRSLGKRVLSSEMDDHWVEMNEAMEGILDLQQKFIDAHTAFYALFDEMRNRNRICTADHRIITNLRLHGISVVAQQLELDAFLKLWVC